MQKCSHSWYWTHCRLIRYIYYISLLSLPAFPFHGVLLLSGASNTFLVLLQCLYNIVLIIISAAGLCDGKPWTSFWTKKGLLSSPAIICRRELLDIIIISWFLGLHNTKQEYGIAETTALYHLPQRRWLSIVFFCLAAARRGALRDSGPSGCEGDYWQRKQTRTRK